MAGRVEKGVARVRSSVIGVSILTTSAYLLLLGVLRLTGRPVGLLSIVIAVVVGLVAGGSVGWERFRRQQAEQDAGGAEVLASADRACRFGERPADPSLASAARDWVRLRARRRRRSSRSVLVACAAGVTAGLAVGSVAHRPLGYGIAACSACWRWRSHSTSGLSPATSLRPTRS